MTARNRPLSGPADEVLARKEGAGPSSTTGDVKRKIERAFSTLGLSVVLTRDTVTLHEKEEPCFSVYQAKPTPQSKRGNIKTGRGNIKNGAIFIVGNPVQKIHFLKYKDNGVAGVTTMSEMDIAADLTKAPVFMEFVNHIKTQTAGTRMCHQGIKQPRKAAL